MQEIETKAASALAWFAAKVARGAVAANYFLGPVIVFLAGWWWGVLNHPEEEAQ
jgi:hypothetical protein